MRRPGRRVAATSVAAAIGLSASACGVLPAPKLSDAQQVIADMKLASRGLTVVATTDHPDGGYGKGDKIVLTVSVDRDASIAVLRVVRSGDTLLVFPNRDQTAQVPADRPIRIPAEGSTAAITADATGPELFVVVASTVGTSFLFGRKPAAGAPFADLGVTTRPLAKQITDSLKLGAVGFASRIVQVE